MRGLNATAASLLGFLQQGRMTGWDLARAVEGSIGYFWNVTRSQIYRELRTLEAQGMVEGAAAGQRDKRPFSITPAGRAAFKAWIRREPGAELIRFPLLLSVFFGEHLDEDHLRRFLTTHRLRHEQRFDRYRDMLRALGNAEPYAAATLRFGVEYEEAALRWFDALPWPSRAPKRDARKRTAPPSRPRRGKAASA